VGAQPGEEHEPQEEGSSAEDVEQSAVDEKEHDDAAEEEEELASSGEPGQRTEGGRAGVARSRPLSYNQLYTLLLVAAAAVGLVRMASARWGAAAVGSGSGGWEWSYTDMGGGKMGTGVCNRGEREWSWWAHTWASNHPRCNQVMPFQVNSIHTVLHSATDLSRAGTQDLVSLAESRQAASLRVSADTQAGRIAGLDDVHPSLARTPQQCGGVLGLSGSALLLAAAAAAAWGCCLGCGHCALGELYTYTSV
jgi:hypothetical protein